MGDRASLFEELEFDVRDAEADVVSVSVSLPEDSSSQESATGADFGFEAEVWVLGETVSFERVLTTSGHWLTAIREGCNLGPTSFGWCCVCHIGGGCEDGC